jgi:hypothetical protein
VVCVGVRGWMGVCGWVWMSVCVSMRVRTKNSEKECVTES